MKKIIFSINPGIWDRFPSSRESWKIIAIEIARYNGTFHQLDMDFFIEEMMKEVYIATVSKPYILVKSPDGNTYTLTRNLRNNAKIKYATITKINIS